MSRRVEQRLLCVLGMVVACRSLPLTEPELEPSPDAPTSGAPGDQSSAGSATISRSGSGSGGAPSAGAGAAQAGSDSPPSSGGKPPITPGETDGGAAGERGGEPSAGDGNLPVYGPFEGPPRCSSNRIRDPNESEGPEMNPGFACIFCHEVSNAGSGEADAPIFTFAGTLYPSVHEPDSCIGGGADAAIVIVNDAAGQELRALANASGNFLFEEAVLTPPYSVKVLFDGRERAATTPHTESDCNRCHTQLGLQGAPGRVVLP